MNRQKTVLIACGTAVATSTVVAAAIEEAMKERGIRVEVRQCKATEVRGLAEDADVIVATTPVPEDLGKPVFKGLPFLTGLGKDRLIEEIAEALRA